MRVNYYVEKTNKAWMLRLLLGPSAIIDGVVLTLSFGFLNTGCALYVARKLSHTRMKNEQ